MPLGLVEPPAKSEGPEETAACDVGAGPIDRYLEATRARIAPFVDAHYTFSGARALHRRALGWDLVRAPVNVLLVGLRVLLSLSAWLPRGARRLALRFGDERTAAGLQRLADCLSDRALLPALVRKAMRSVAALVRRAGWQRAADWLVNRRLVLETDVAREIDRLVRTELLQLPNRRGPGESPHCAFVEEVLTNPRIDAASHDVAETLVQRMGDAAFRRDLDDNLAAYIASRSAMTEVFTAITSVAIGVVWFNQLTLGALSLGPAIATEVAQRAAIERFPLGTWLGGLWYDVFPVTASVPSAVASVLAVFLAFSVFAAFAGIVMDPVLRRLGLHRRRLEKLVDVMEPGLRGAGSGRFLVPDHWIGRILDVVDLLRQTWSKLH